MPKFFLLACLVLSSMMQVNAKILRVGIEYASFATAHTAAVSGDTLQIYGNQNNGTVTKRLVIIGFGYNFDVHPGLQAIGTESPSQLDVYFQTGSDSSIIEGIEGTVRIYDVSKIIVRRCRTNVLFYNQNRAINDVKIISSVLYSGGTQYTNFPVTNLFVYNCILGSSLSLSNGGLTSNGALINCVSSTTSIIGTVLSLGQGSYLVKNCILSYASAASHPNTVFESCFFGEAAPVQLPQGSNNRWGQTWANLFDRLGGTSDQPSYYGYAVFDENYFILKAGSPAINGGTNAAGNPTNCGIFGGEPIYGYRPSGVPAVPSIYKLTAPTTSATTNPYNVTLSVRSNN